MEYVHVVSRVPTSKVLLNIEKAVIRIVLNCLFSLIGGLRQNEFGYNTILKVAQEIKNYRDSLLEPYRKKMYVDSGGYSIIKGDIGPQDTMKAIECYHQYLELERDNFDFIYSLDIPVNLKFQSFNTKDNLHRYNHESLRRSKDVILKYPDVRDKFYFVWQFKMMAQYEVWNRIYDELELNKVIKHRALGGMVSLRMITKIDFSPFIGMAYRCLYDYLLAEFFDQPFRLHYLGINLIQDRFHIVFLEKLFQKYLEGISTVRMTYDSISFSRSAYNNYKKLMIYHFNDAELHIFGSVIDTPLEVLLDVYTPELLPEIEAEIENVKAKRRLNYIESFTPLNVYSNLSLDRFFSYLVERYEMVKVMEQSEDYLRFEHEIRKILNDISERYPGIFTKHLRASVIENMRLTYRFHAWFRNSCDPAELESLVRAFIEMIKFPEIIR